MTGGIAGSLRQEFRELELLDEITRLRYLGQVPPCVVGITRNELIHSFRRWKGENFIPKSMHRAIKWSQRRPFPIDPATEDSPWTVIKTSSKEDKSLDSQKVTTRDTSNFIPAKGTQALKNIANVTIQKGAKRKRIEEEEEEEEKEGQDAEKLDVQVKKRAKPITVTAPPAGKLFKGIPWDNVNWSCAYDSLMTVMLSVYTECSENWRLDAAHQSEILLRMGELFDSAASHPATISVAEVRNTVRNMLSCINPELGPQGPQYTDLYELSKNLLAVDEDVMTTSLLCRACQYASPEVKKSEVV